MPEGLRVFRAQLRDLLGDLLDGLVRPFDASFMGRDVGPRLSDLLGDGLHRLVLAPTRLGLGGFEHPSPDRLLIGAERLLSRRDRATRRILLDRDTAPLGFKRLDPILGVLVLSYGRSSAVLLVPTVT